MMNIVHPQETHSDFFLDNSKLKVTFNHHGISLIEDIALARSFQLNRDDFSIAIEGEVIESSFLSPKEIIPDKEALTYHFLTPKYAIKVVYELKPGWRFVSKQMYVTPVNDSKIRVENVTVLINELDENVVSEYVPRTRRPNLQMGDFGAFLRFEDATGMFVLVQNPFLEYQRQGTDFSIGYRPDMYWEIEYGAFASDRGCIGTYGLTGQHVQAKLIPEWQWTRGILPVTDAEQDWAEVRAYTACVRAFILPYEERSINIHIAWCENDYQIDVATPQGREEYKRIIDRAAEMGLDYVLFAPVNSALDSHEKTADDWNWENVLWLGLGIKIRKGEWRPGRDEIPSSIQEMLDYARAKKIRLVSYYYPVMPFEGNPEWIIEGAQYHRKKRNASIGFRSYQDFMIDLMSQFYEKTGIGGYAYDYTFLWYDQPSRYAQWWGWKRIKETLRNKYPDIVIDGRQLDMFYGPWTWLSGSYPHPTYADEQPESFNPFPDLHFDRVSANRQRYTAYIYRVADYCPPELVPGFITHQTSRKQGDTLPKSAMETKTKKTILRRDSFRTRDWDYLGWKYSLISSIATGGLNNAVSMIPARDMSEYQNFSAADISFFRGWLEWTDEKRPYLLNTRPILGQPTIGRVDGTSAIVKDRGYIFLFNPNARKMHARFHLDVSIGLQEGEEFVLKELFPIKARLIGKPHAGAWAYGDEVVLSMDGASSVVLELIPADTLPYPRLYNIPGKVTFNGDELIITQCRGEVGTMIEALVQLPPDAVVKTASVNRQNVRFSNYNGLISIRLGFMGTYFSHMQQLDRYDPGFQGGKINGDFTIPKRIFRQLKHRKEAWPIPWTEIDYQTTWLVPERLLLFVQIAEVKEEMDVRLRIDGKVVELTRAYSSVRAHQRCFVGFYADFSGLQADRVYQFELILPKLRPGQYQGLFFENIETEITDEIDIVE